ncbi:hypothetical protein EEW87_012975 [Janibacter melonis]|uniref:Uncharacterized protein n=1 Tax=Janibacter melonis TaxID=262209 RepID=A0A5P8FN30_9MICO|nr:hypothetical protein [Janibacter melonis]QFQ31029.2 hypothetical protein EEW87_012975 [Janibacter melonis]
MPGASPQLEQQPTSPESPVTDALRQAHELLACARDDPGRSSRWAPKRRRAESLYWAREERLRYIQYDLRDDLIDEAAERVLAVSVSPQHPWQWRPEIRHVLDELDSLDKHILVDKEDVARRIYRDAVLALDQDDLRLVERLALDLSEDDFSVLRRRSFVSKPHQAWTSGSREYYEEVGYPEADPDLIRLLQSPAARAPRPVTLWRGEHPNPHMPEFAEAVRSARPGDILTRTRIPMSCSIDPAGASSSEFTLHSDGLAPRGDDDSWLLEITTSQLLYAGNRVERTGRSDGNAATEREALVFAPRLQVEGHREALVPCRHGLKRLHVVAVVPA